MSSFERLKPDGTPTLAQVIVWAGEGAENDGAIEFEDLQIMRELAQFLYDIKIDSVDELRRLVMDLPENLVRNPLLDIADIEYTPGTNRARKICCKSCSETVFEVPDNPSQEQNDKAVKDLVDHFKVAHQINVVVSGRP